MRYIVAATRIVVNSVLLIPALLVVCFYSSDPSGE
jgi:hypothetical protein